MKDKKIRPEIKNNDIDMSQYDEIILGFPIWWYVAPTIVNTFWKNMISQAKDYSVCNIRRKWIWQYG